MLVSYLKSWQVMLCFFARKYDVHKKVISEMKEGFYSIPLEHNLVLNMLSYCAFVCTMNWLIGFSEEHQKFVIMWSIIPSLIAGMAYYYYLYGFSAFCISLTTIFKYGHNLDTNVRNSTSLHDTDGNLVLLLPSGRNDSSKQPLHDNILSPQRGRVLCATGYLSSPWIWVCSDSHDAGMGLCVFAQLGSS